MAVLNKTVAEYLADVAGVVTPYAGADTVTIVDTGANIIGLTALEFADLDDNGVDFINASDDILTFDDVDDALALAASTVTVHSSDLLILADTGGDIGNLSDSDFSDLSAKGFAIISPSDNILALTVAQYNAITAGNIAIDAGATVTLADTAGNLQALSAAAISVLDSNGIDIIDSTGNALSLTAAQYLALGTVALTGADVVTLADTGANIAALSVTNIGDLDAAQFDIDTINASDDVLALSVAQYDALGTVTLTAGDAVALTDTGTNLAALNAAAINALSNIDSFNASDDAVSFTKSQLDALADGTAIALTAGDTVTFGDTQANIEALTSGNFTSYIAQGVDIFDSTDNNALTLTVAKGNAVAVASKDFAAGDAVTVTDTAANIEALTATQITALDDANVDTVNASDDNVSLTAAQAAAINGMNFGGDDVITVDDTNTNLATLTATDIDDLAFSGATSVTLDATGGVAITFTAAQAAAMDALVDVDVSDSLVVADTGAGIAGLTATDLGDLNGTGASSVTLNASDDAFTWTAAQGAALGTGIDFHNSDAVTIADSTANIETLTSGDLDDLDAAGAASVTIDSSDNAYTVNATEAAAIDGILLAGTDTVTVSDNDIQSIAFGDITTLAAKAAAVIFDAGDDAYTLSEAQAAVIGDISLAASDAVLVSEAALGDLTSSQIANLASKAATVTFNEVGGNDAYTIDATEAAEIGDILLTAGDTITISDTGANIQTLLTDTVLANLAAKGATILIDASSPYNLSIAQFQALGDITLTAGDTITLLDTGANLAALTVTEIGTLAGYNIDLINASDNSLNLSVAQYQALGAVNLTNSDTVTIVDTGTNIASLTAGDIAALPGSGVDVLNATNDAITWTAAQAAAISSGVNVDVTDTVTVSDTGANIGALATSDLTDLANLSATVVLDASDNVIALTAAQAAALGDIEVDASDAITISIADVGALSTGTLTTLAALDATVTLDDTTGDAYNFTVAQYLVLGDILLTAGDAVTISDTAANIEALTATQINALDSAGYDIDIIDSTDNTLSLTVAQYTALGTVALTGADVVTLADTSTNIATLTATQIDDLDAGQFDIDTIDATDNALSLTVAQYDALGTVTLTGADVVTLADTGTNLSALNAAAINALSNVDIFDATNNAVTFDKTQLDALADGTAIALTAGDTVTFGDTQANIEGLTAGDFTSYIAQGVDIFDSTDNNALNLAADQAAALITGGKIAAAADTVTLLDSQANIEALTETQIAGLDNAGFDAINSTDDALNLTVAQATSLGTTVIVGADVVTVVDSGANIAAMTTTQIAALDNSGVDAIDATGNTISLTVAQATALGTVVIAAGDVVTLADTGTNIAAMTTTQLDALSDNGIDTIDATSTLNLTVAQYNALGTVTLTAGDTVNLADTGADLAGLNAAAINALSNVDTFDATDNAVTFDKSQLDALADGTAIALTAGDTVTFGDTSANIQGLSDANIATYIAQGVDVFDSTNTNVLSVTAAQAAAVSGTAAIFASGDAVTLSDTGTNITNMSDGDWTGLAAAGVDTVDASDDAYSLSAAEAAGVGTVALAASDAVAVTGTGAQLDDLTSTQIDNLSDKAAVVTINASDDVLTLSAAQAAALGDVGIHASDVVTVSDTGANLAALTPGEITILDNLAAAVTLDATNNVLSLTVAQYLALGANTVNLTSADVVTLADTGANIAALTTTQIDNLDNAAFDIDAINASDNVLELTLAQFNLLGTVALTGGDEVTLTATGTEIAAMTTTQITALGTAGIDIINLTNNAVTLTVAQFNALGSVVFDAGDAITVTALTTTGNDTVNGSAGSDVIDGLAGNDSITGNDGNDTITGNTGNDTINGNGGDDSLSGDVGKDSLSGGDDNDELSGGDDNDTLNGGAGDDSLDGGDDKDILNGDDGEDELSGGLKNDTLNGGDDDDTLNGGDGTDSLLGGEGDDELNGDAGSDKLFGGDGEDTLNGGIGTDRLYGNEDGDELNGGDGNDKLYGSDGEDAAGDGDDTMNGGIGNDQLFGEDGADVLNGDAGSDKIHGNDGNDTLSGGEGKDQLWGEAGSDTFIFTAAAATANVQTLKDFSVADDSIQIDNDNFGALGGAAPLNANFFVNGTEAADADDYIIYQQSTGKLWYDADGNGAGAKIQIALVSTKVALTAADFEVIA